MMRSRICLCVLCAIIGAALAVLLLMEAPQSHAQAKGPVSFINDVAPIFKENCFACHDAKKRKGKLDMTTFDALRKGGEHQDEFPILVPGKPDDSYLVQLLKLNTARRMPPPKESPEPLAKDKIAIIEQWVREGAKSDVPGNADLLRELRLRWKAPQPPAAYTRPTLINALAFTPDNKKLVVGGHHELLIW